MADFLVTIDGKYLYYGWIKESVFNEYLNSLEPIPFVGENISDYIKSLVPNEEFSPDDYSFVYNDNTGRVEIAHYQIALYSHETNIFKGYMNIERFWDSAKIVEQEYTVDSTKVKEDIRYYRRFDGKTIIPKIDIVTPEPGDRIFLVRRRIVIVEQGANEIAKLQTVIKKFNFPHESEVSEDTYKLIKNGLDYSVKNKKETTTQVFENDFFEGLPGYELIQPPNSDLVNLNNDYKLFDYRKYIIDNGFKRLGFNSPDDLTVGEINIINSVIMLFDHIFRLDGFIDKLNELGYFSIFQRHFELIVSSSGAGNVLTTEEYYSTFTPKYFDLLYVRLHEFYTWAKIQVFDSWVGEVLEVGNYELLSRIYGVFDPITLQEIDYDIKIDLLTRLLSDNWWVSGRWNPFLPSDLLTEEDVIVKIIQSVEIQNSDGLFNHEDINRFMDFF